MIVRTGPRAGHYRPHDPPPLPPELALRAVRLYQGSPRKPYRLGLMGVARALGLTRVNPLRVLLALEAAGVRLRGTRTWDPRRKKWLYHKAPSPAVAAECAAWRRYRAYCEVMEDRHRRRSSRPWPPDAKAKHLATLWRNARTKRPVRIPPPKRPLRPSSIAFLASRGYRRHIIDGQNQHALASPAP